MKHQHTDISLREYFETRMDGFEKSLDNLKTNHFLHLEKKIDKIMWFIITTLLAVIVHMVGMWLHSP